MGTAAETFEGEVRELARGDSDSLVDFFEGLVRLSRRYGVVRILRAEPAVKLVIGAESTTTLLYHHGPNDRLSSDEIRRFAENRDADNSVNVLVHDLLNDAWRVANGQEIEGSVTVKLD